VENVERKSCSQHWLTVAVRAICPVVEPVGIVVVLATTPGGSLGTDRTTGAENPPAGVMVAPRFAEPPLRRSTSDALELRVNVGPGTVNVEETVWVIFFCRMCHTRLRWQSRCEIREPV
jgi:hypothetical protein